MEEGRTSELATQPAALNFLLPYPMDSDSHGQPSTYGFVKDMQTPDGALQFCNLTLTRGKKYTIIYPKNIFPTSMYRKAKGVFEFKEKDKETLLTHATIWFPDNSKQSGVECDITILEGMQVIDSAKKDEVITVGFPPPPAKMPPGLSHR
jgi:hypothetical protein